MENESPSTHAFEVRCESCNVSFPSGTRLCLHCGAKLNKRLSWGEDEAASHPEEGEVSIGRRLGSASMWIVLAVVAALARLCER
ncbi:MAG: hypothetical protein AAEJ53_20330 [Myxococcota bacterium]